MTIALLVAMDAILVPIAAAMVPRWTRDVPGWLGIPTVVGLFLAGLLWLFTLPTALGLASMPSVISLVFILTTMRLNATKSEGELIRKALERRATRRGARPPTYPPTTDETLKLFLRAAPALLVAFVLIVVTSLPMLAVGAVAILIVIITAALGRLVATRTRRAP